MTDDELEKRIAETRHELFNLRFQASTGALENTARLRLARREIAAHPHDQARARLGLERN